MPKESDNLTKLEKPHLTQDKEKQKLWSIQAEFGFCTAWMDYIQGDHWMPEERLDTNELREIDAELQRHFLLIHDMCSCFSSILEYLEEISRRCLWRGCPTATREDGKLIVREPDITQEQKQLSESMHALACMHLAIRDLLNEYMDIGSHTRELLQHEVFLWINADLSPFMRRTFLSGLKELNSQFTKIPQNVYGKLEIQ